MPESEAEPLILPLDSPLATLDRTGGKGASLARLASAGLPVPPGFHVTTDAYRQFVRDNHLGEVIQAAAARANPGSTGQPGPGGRAHPGADGAGHDAGCRRGGDP